MHVARHTDRLYSCLWCRRVPACLRARMHEQPLPQAGELVAVQVSRIPEGNTGVYVELLEYGW